jgi:hypothetical protein
MHAQSADPQTKSKSGAFMNKIPGWQWTRRLPSSVRGARRCVTQSARPHATADGSATWTTSTIGSTWLSTALSAACGRMAGLVWLM